MRHIRINTICTLSIVVSLFIVVVILVMYVSTSSNRMVAALQVDNLDQTARLVAQSAQNSIQDAVAVAKALSGQAAIREAFTGSPQRAQECFQTYVTAFPTYWSFLLFDTKGRILAGLNAEHKDLTGGDRLHRDYSQAIFGGKDLAFSQGIMKASSGDVLIYVVAKAIHDKDGKLLGAVAVCPRWNDFTEHTIDPIRLGQRGYGFILDRKGRIIAHSTDKKLLLSDMSKEDFVRRAVALGSGKLDYRWKGEAKILSVARIPETGWLVCMNAYRADLTAQATTQRRVLLLIGLVAMLSAGALLTFINHRLIFGPLGALSEFTAKVTSGDLKATMHGQFRAELAMFAEHLRAMTDELKKRLGFSEGVLRSIPLPTTILDADCKLLWVNQQSCDLVEKKDPPASYVGMGSGEFILGDATKHPIVDKAVTERIKIDTTTDLAAPSGKVHQITVAASPIYDMDGNFLGGMVFWNDISGLKRQQRQIEEQNAVIAHTAAEASTVADRMASAAQELSTRIQQSAAGAENQRQRVQDTAAAVEEMNATILEVAKNAASTAANTENVHTTAVAGEALVRDVVKAVLSVRDEAEALKGNMHDLGEKAQGIGAVLGVISDIADQTNLLALNAAIEAARAGEAGRGFAVVADEVRKLAEKTMQATGEVGQAISGIQQGTRETVSRVERAVTAVAQAAGLAERSGGTLAEIVGLVQQSGDEVSSIATAAEQQSATSEEINRAVEEINRLSEETAEAMGQSNQAVAELAELAQRLNTLISDLKNGSSGHKALSV